MIFEENLFADNKMFDYEIKQLSGFMYMCKVQKLMAGDKESLFLK